MKGSKVTFQLPFMAENDKKFSAKRFFNLSRTIFHSAEIDFSFGAERKIACLRLKNHLAQKNPPMKANLFRSTRYLQTCALGI